MTSILIKDAQRKKYGKKRRPWEDGGRGRSDAAKSQETLEPQEAGEGKHFGGDTALRMPGFWTSSLQNYDRINFVVSHHIPPGN